MKQKIVVIGSGFGGLSAATRLAIRGHEVTLLEKQNKLGGRAYVYEQNGFKFDGGPTVITAPWLFDEIWEAAGRNREDYFQLVPCDPLRQREFEECAEGHRPEHGDPHAAAGKARGGQVARPDAGGRHQ